MPRLLLTGATGFLGRHLAAALVRRGYEVTALKRPASDLSKLGDNEEVFSQKTSMFFKTTRIYRMVDKPHNTIVYVAISTKIINGSPANAISTVPIVHWQQ